MVYAGKSKAEGNFDERKRDFLKKGGIVALSGAAAVALGMSKSNAGIFFSDNSNQTSAGMSKEEGERISIALG